jgi:hypothetical protein
MDAAKWKQNKVPAFIDQSNTKFFKGPFVIDDIEYDYRLVDESGEDYCTVEQMEEWYVDIVQKIKPEE